VDVEAAIRPRAKLPREAHSHCHRNARHRPTFTLSKPIHCTATITLRSATYTNAAHDISTKHIKPRVRHLPRASFSLRQQQSYRNRNPDICNTPPCASPSTA